MNTNLILNSLLQSLPELHAHHAPGTATYSLLKAIARREVGSVFSSLHGQHVQFGPFGEVALPYFKMGAVDSLNLFDIDELIIFSYYFLSRKKYRRVLDIGANIGLHSILLSRCGFEVRAFEPDPVHFEVLTNNLRLNHCDNVQAVNAAVSNVRGSMEFVRVKGNTTGSHLAGSKPNPYGELERFPVKVEAIGEHLAWADLIKLDAEGHEKQILLGAPASAWKHVDVLAEVSSVANAEAIFEHFAPAGMAMFAQKIGWHRVERVADIPVSHHEGTLFITSGRQIDWR